MTTRKTQKTIPKAQSKQVAAKQQLISKPKKKPTRKRKPTPASWVKGQSGNPKGRAKKGNTWTDIINEIMEAKSINVVMNITDESGTLSRKETKINAVGSQRNIRQLIAVQMVKQALEGDNTAQKTLIEHEVGRAMQMNVNANLTPEELPTLKKGEDPIAVLLAKFTKGQ